jgi:hypothetical protein
VRRLVVAAVGLLLFGCSAPAAIPPPGPLPSEPAPTDTPRLDQVRTTVDALVRAVRERDRTSFDGLISDRDRTFPDRARLLYDNLSTLPLTRLNMRVEPAEFGLTETRRQLLGTSAWTQRAMVSWRLAGDDAEVEHLVWLTFLADGGQVKLAGTIDQPHTNVREQQPSWWLGPLTASERGGAAVVVGAGQSLARWTTRAADALDHVRHDLPNGLRPSWTGHVVIEVPATQRDFDLVLGQPSGSYAAIAAVTHREGTARGAIRIVVNPKTSQLKSAELQAVLEHEMVHVATASPDSPAPVWAEEGLAEWVATRDSAVERREAADDVLSTVRDHGAPRSLPSDKEFQAGARNLRFAYAEAWLACRYIADRYSETQLGRLYGELDRGRSLDEASRATLGLSEARLIAGWRAYLVRLAHGSVRH